MEVLHLITQDNQPYGSQRKCCERCGKAVWDCDNYVTEKHMFTKEFAKSNDLIRCIDKGS